MTSWEARLLYFAYSPGFSTDTLFPSPSQIFTNKCERPGCRQREMMKLTCERCGRNFCIKHRHPLDHDCSGQSHPTSRAG